MGVLNLSDMMSKAFGQRTKTLKTTVAAAYAPLVAEESDKSTRSCRSLVVTVISCVVSARPFPEAVMGTSRVAPGAMDVPVSDGPASLNGPESPEICVMVSGLAPMLVRGKLLVTEDPRGTPSNSSMVQVA